MSELQPDANVQAVTAVPGITVNVNGGQPATNMDGGMLEQLKAVLQQFWEQLKGEAPEEPETMKGGNNPETPLPPAANTQIVIPAEISELVELVKGVGGVDAVKRAITAANALVANGQAQRANLIKRLTANKRCAFSETDLQGFSDEQLDKLADSLREPDYSGRGVQTVNRAELGDEDDGIEYVDTATVIANNQTKNKGGK